MIEDQLYSDICNHIKLQTFQNVMSQAISPSIRMSSFPTKTSTLNPCRIHEICVDYVDRHLFTKYLHGSHVDTFHVDKIHVGSILISNVHSKIHVNSMLLIYVAA